ncbi:uncharacterized protein LOC141697906 [Apium graveolens]|uniref:uncharacterized protein LOC141697906 n=1 Tax=Apium graveolens TaxID=4045 RepID=UPI003D7B2591
MNNDFSGNIPTSLGSLGFLRYLNLRNNKFHGQLPLSFGNLFNLVGLDVGKNNLSDVLPSWELFALRYLILRSNHFYGKIPTELCHCGQVLDLAMNHITGNIPRCFSNFTFIVTSINPSEHNPHVNVDNNVILVDAKGSELAYTTTSELLFSINLSNNNISGEIPEELMDLHWLLSLNLAGNHLSGRIPGKIGKLEKLEFLDLSRNELYGAIPQSLSYLNFLSHLNLSFNDLTGRIPDGNQLQTLNDPSVYVGNKHLYGGPILEPFPKGTDSNGFRDNSKADIFSDDEHMWLYAGIGPGLLVGFLGFCGSLHFIKSWRYFYFHNLELVFNKLAVSIALFQRKFRN